MARFAIKTPCGRPDRATSPRRLSRLDWLRQLPDRLSPQDSLGLSFASRGSVPEVALPDGRVAEANLKCGRLRHGFLAPQNLADGRSAIVARTMSIVRPSPFRRVRHSVAVLLASSLLALPSCSNDSGTGGRARSGPVGAAGSADPGNSGALVLHMPWEWTGIVGTGQSLSVGEPDGLRYTRAAAARLTTQPFSNKQLSTGRLPWPVDANDASLSLVPLVEPIGRRSAGYPSSWPTNIAGETQHAAMANEITSLVRAAGGTDYVTIHSAVGENGQCLAALIKGATPVGVTGRAYEATLIETRAITRLAQAEGKTYGVGAITVTHGECDAGDTTYASRLHQLWTDYVADIAAITGQTQPPLLIVSQQHSTVGDRAASTLEQWRVGLIYPNDAVCSGPKYQYPYTPDSIHLTVEGYELLGEKYAQVYYERVVLGRDWQPLQPTKVERDGRVVTVTFHVPVGPLVWETSLQEPHQGTPAWSAGKGFELRAAAAPIGIASVEIVGDAVEITAAVDLPPSGLTVGYAQSADPPATAGGAPPAMIQPFVGTFRWGLLRDSDPFVGYSTQQPQPNFAVAFELPVP